MDLWLSLALVAMTVTVYMVVVEIFTAAFSMTGLTVTKARFQVVSLFTGAGFTTTESEIITVNRNRKRLATICMITGNVINCVIIGLIANVLLNLKQSEAKSSSFIILIVASSFLLICLFLRIPAINRRWQAALEYIARRFFRRKKLINVLSVIDYYGKDEIVDVLINKMPSEIKGKELREIQFKQNYDANILMIKRKNRDIEVLPSTILEIGDHVMIFGNRKEIERLFRNNYQFHLDENVKTNNINIIDNIAEKSIVRVDLNIVPKDIIDKTLQESNIKEEHDINVILIKRDGKSIDPTKDTKLMAGDQVFLYGKYPRIKHFFSDN